MQDNVYYIITHPKLSPSVFFSRGSHGPSTKETPGVPLARRSIGASASRGDRHLRSGGRDAEAGEPGSNLTKIG